MTQKPLSEGESDTGNQTQKWAEVSKSHVYSAFKDSMSYTYCCLGLELILHDFTWFMLRPCHRILSKFVLCNFLTFFYVQQMLKVFKHACIWINNLFKCKHAWRLDVSSKFQTNSWRTLIKQPTPYQAVTFHFPKGGGLIGVQLFLFLSIDYYKMLRKWFWARTSNMKSQLALKGELENLFSFSLLLIMWVYFTPNMWDTVYTLPDKGTHNPLSPNIHV